MEESLSTLKFWKIQINLYYLFANPSEGHELGKDTWENSLSVWVGDKVPKTLTTRDVRFICNCMWVRNSSMVAAMGAARKMTLFRLWMSPIFSNSFFSFLLRAGRQKRKCTKMNHRDILQRAWKTPAEGERHSPPSCLQALSRKPDFLYL